MSEGSPSELSSSAGDVRSACASVHSKDPVPDWPYVAYAGAWVAFAAVALWQLLSLPAGEPVHGSTAYTSVIAAGVALTATGPLVTILAWVLGRRGGASALEAACSALIKGALTMLGGVCLWWATLIIVDRFRLGRVL